MDFHEKLRLLYVALTRARDHLVVSVHRPAKEPARRPHDVDARRAAVGRRRASSRAGTTSSRAPTIAGRGARRRRGRPSRAAPAAVGRVARGARRRARATRPRATRAFGHRARAMPRRPSRASRRRSRAGQGTRATSSCRRGTRAATAPRSAARCTRCCRPSTSPPAPALDDAAAAQAAAEGVLGREDDVAALARVALATRRRARGGRARLLARDVRRHAGRRHHARGLRRPRLPHDPTAWSSSTTRPTRGATTPTSTPRSTHYRLQGASYAVALEQATGEPVAECVFVFLGGDEAPASVAVSDLPAAMREVRAALAASSAAATTPARPRSGR